jgi:endoglucanase
MQRNKTGTLACTIGAPIRNMHSTVQLCHLGDIAYTIELLKVFLEKVHKIDTFLK